MREAMSWLRRYERFWSARLDGLAVFAERKGSRSAEQETMTSLSLVRRIRARPAIVFDAVTSDGEGVAHWWGA